MKIGYACVSSDDQRLDFQRNALHATSCDPLYEEKESAGRMDRPELLRPLNLLHPVSGWRLRAQSLPRLSEWR